MTRVSSLEQAAKDLRRWPARNCGPGTVACLVLAMGGLASPSLAAATDPVPASAIISVPEPDLSELEPSVQARLRDARGDWLAASHRAGVTAEALADAYGELGRLYHAHHLYDAAESCYRNAQALMPSAFRWPYLLGFLHQKSARLEEAAQSYQRALEIRPGHGTTQLRLAQVYLHLGRRDEAQRLLERAVNAEDLEAPVAFELGKLALAQREYEHAVTWLERARQEQPQASRIHYPLAMAYRGVGDVAKAKEFIRKRGDVKPTIPDPLVDGLTKLVSGARPHIYRANKAALAQQYDVAAQGFRQAVTQDPDNLPARVRLGRTLYLLGDKEGARRELKTALGQEPGPENEAHFYMGLLLDEDGSDEAAVHHYRATLTADPAHTGAHLQIANALMRLGRYDDAASHYAEFIQYVPYHLPARLMEVLALVRAGSRHRKAIERLQAALVTYPDDPVLTQALARLLAASPDARVRDGARALAYGEMLHRRYGGPEVAETLSMAYAELGRFDEAVALQQQAIAFAAFAGQTELAARLGANLKRYQEGVACRSPWAADDPIFMPPRGDASDYGA